MFGAQTLRAWPFRGSVCCWPADCAFVPCLCASACLSGDAGSQGAQSGLQQLGHSLRRPPAPSDRRAAPCRGLHQPLWQDQVLHRGDDQGPLQSGKGAHQNVDAR